MTIKSIVALALLAFTLPATAGKVTVHNHGHYLAAFQVSDQDSGVFPIGQSRTMENVSGPLKLKYRNLFGWARLSWFNTNDPNIETLFDVKADGNIEVTFMGDIFNPIIKINDVSCEIVPYFSLRCS